MPIDLCETVVPQLGTLSANVNNLIYKLVVLTANIS
ncbi:hypothetical protein VCSRO147_2759 [Vibrio cholerae]|jgi:hypothetical protein|nr:hypothetical protein SAMEA4374365_00331 [Vibrio cholerae]SYZ80392.1 Uncharacterised protein [Vibrio paracholerae]BCK04137.1 hypothetical protein VCSRO162_2271 [Vibrio cholerae]GHW09946.1 hypothetical protein VCSRO192_1645 [Vibrio cholerae]GHW20618.1 hypothetical protein VCSRO193_0630 [Vibrio cholerae]